MKQEIFHYDKEFKLESGETLQDLTIAFKTYGQLSADRSNVIWVCHHLTANAEVDVWWPGMVGKGYSLDPEKHFIVCANILGSCYGTTGPISINPKTGEPYYYDFPFFTIRDIVNAHILLRKHLEIDKIQFCIGGSCGGNQVLEFTLLDPGVIQNCILLASNARESAWSIAVHTTQRLALEADGSWGERSEDAGKNGLKAARGVGTLTYRSIETFINRQTDQDLNKVNGFKASSYIEHQGKKLVDRFNAHSYWHLSKALDTHNIGRNRGSVESLLQQINIPFLIIGISSDMLIPASEQQYLADYLPDARLEIIDSSFGHDGFMVEIEKISFLVRGFVEEKTTT
ncbi:homoserine O-acetyltransferase family protein [Xanthovirga aplysinae]|uniref:homoserine O-acetyltransferase family protein n=1 Tax=Xanthovirga aplysinae TaxID=2529853 RepID=UPI0012BC5214|nr:homoserine O-acetyltransferase [Xanthovirga aplysinae]MTI31611.1 homoserine O-acetyltransferase [Xanthovirga aplysinae]